VKLETTDQGLTSYAGLLPVIRFVQKQLGFRGLCSETVAHERGANAAYELADERRPLADVIELTVLGVLGGAASLTGVCHVWADERRPFADSVLRRVAGWTRLPVDTTLGRVFKEVDRREVVALETLNHRLRGRVWRRLMQTGERLRSAAFVMWVDVDSTVATVFGEQEGTAKGYNEHKRGAKSYPPLLGFCAETKEILQGWLRSGDAYTSVETRRVSNGMVLFMQQLAASVNRKVRLVWRADSGFFAGETLDCAESRGDGYLIKVKMRNLVGLLSRQVWLPVPGQSGWEETTFEHQCGTWSRSRTFKAVRQRQEANEPTAQLQLLEAPEYDYFCYVTNLSLTPWETHKTYGKRATCEAWIEEAKKRGAFQKNQMGLAALRTDEFQANAALFQCAVLAYNLVRWMALLSGDEQLRRWEMKTVRTFLLRVAGKLACGGRQLTLKTPEEHLHARQWASWVAVSA
jgi:hypothetical protein